MIKLSFIVLAYDMQRELPKTLHSLSESFQKDVTSDEFEIILIENQSRNLLDANKLKAQYPNLKYFLNKDRPSSPA